MDNEQEELSIIVTDITERKLAEEVMHNEKVNTQLLALFCLKLLPTLADITTMGSIQQASI